MKIKPNQGNSNYKVYLSSGRWAELKMKFLHPGSKCRACDSTHWLTLHHKTYENLGHETENDFIILCYRCHKKIHFSNKGYLRQHRHTIDIVQKLYAKKRRREIWLKKKELSNAIPIVSKEVMAICQ